MFFFSAWRDSSVIQEHVHNNINLYRVKTYIICYYITSYLILSSELIERRAKLDTFWEQYQIVQNSINDFEADEWI